jgi:quercetin dioxygenase-like cupin family protein
MTLSLRRVVTGHDENGRAVVKTDELCRNVAAMRPGASASVIWSTTGFPVDNGDETDGSTRTVSTADPHGTVFRVVEYAPGVTPRNHRTDSIDYAVVIAGEIVMQLDDSEVTLKAGDVLVQRGTIHNWVNRGTVPCIIAFVLIGAKPARAGGHVLESTG